METHSSDLRSPPRRCAPASAPYLKHQNQRSGLTEIFGGAPGSGLALAQGEAALSAQEAPHPCPACGGARSSQPPVTSCLEAGAAVERPQTPLCRSSPGLDSLPPPPGRANQSQLPKWSHLGRTLSTILVRRPEEASPGEDSQRSGCPSCVRGLSLSLAPKSRLSGDQETGTRSLGPGTVLCEKRYHGAPFFYKYPSLPLSVFIG